MPRVAERLNEWFAYAAVADEHGRRREPSTADVAATISADSSHDLSISRTYLASLRNGTQTNPTIAVVEALVAYFRPRLVGMPVEVSANALIGDVGPNRDAGQWDKLLSSGRVRSIALRAGEMTPELQQQILNMMDVLAPEGSASPEPEPRYRKRDAT